MVVMTPTTSSTDDHSSSAAVLDHLDSSHQAHSNHLAAASAVLMKRKRTKRPRHPPPSAAASSSGESTTTEEEDMAHCLILLAQGAAGYAVVDSKPSPSPSPAPPTPTVVDSKPPPSSSPPPPPPAARTERYSSRKYTEADGARAGFYVYECKTCNKCFPTFQALGGHRASHKKPRLATAAEDDAAVATTASASKHHNKPQTTTTTTIGMSTASPPPPPLIKPHIDIAVFPIPDVTTALSLNSSSVVAPVTVLGGGKLRVHECSICGAEFASGQALGGHMRRHRPLNAPADRAVPANIKTEAKNDAGTINLELDLNLPAPSDEEAMSPPPPVVMLGLGQFNDGNKAGLVLTASALVDCHY